MDLDEFIEKAYNVKLNRFQKEALIKLQQAKDNGHDFICVPSRNIGRRFTYETIAKLNYK